MAKRQRLIKDSLGFVVADGRLSIGDPMYDDSRTYRSGEITYEVPAVYDRPARSGKWCARAVTGQYRTRGRRISELICWHESVAGDQTTPDLISSDIGVDSATVCVYESLDGLEECWTKLEPFQAGLHGVCSDSGTGDGTYSVYGRSENGQLVVVRVVYIPDSLGRFPD